ncbi:MAG: hypothetical protein IKC45_06810 [Clostridia bacterium]|nr:hypothetical protein [Clostridia bacterium]
MAKKDERINNMNNETNAVSDDKPLEKKAVEELQEEFSSIFNEDYDDTEEDVVWDESNESFPVFPFRRKERYGNYPNVVDEKEETPKEKKEKKIVFPWKKKSEKDNTEDKSTKGKTESVEDNKKEKEPVIEDEEIAVVETADETSVVEEQNDTVEEVAEEQEAVIEEIPPFEETVEEKKEETIEELPAFEETEEAVIEETEEIEETETPEFVEEIEDEIYVEEAPTEEEIEEVIEFLPPFEDVKAEDSFEKIPPFEEVKAEETFEELPPFEEKAEESVELLPPFQVGEVPVTIPISEEDKQEESKPVKKKKVKEPKVKKEKVQQDDDEPLTKKDHITFVLAIVALVMAVVFVFLKFLPMNNNGGKTPENNIETGVKLSEIQVVRQSTGDKYIQSDIENVYYSVSSENEVKYFEYENGAMKSIQTTGTVNAQVSMDKEKLPVTINYVKTGDSVFGISILRSEDNPGSTLHNVITFKLVDLPEKHKADGKALLLAVANSESASRRYNLWTDIFIVDLKSGDTTRFLTEDNSDSYSVAYSVLTNSAYATDGEMIPFFTTREYGDSSGKKDLFVKNGANESLFATDVYGEYIYADKDVIAYLKTTETGFNIVKKEDTKEEKVVFSLYGNFSTDYLYHQEYILNKNDGNLYNAKTGEEIAIAGYKMSNAEMMSISPDGRYLVVLGTVNSVADYQVHIFDLKKNDYAKFEELNFSQHYNLSFVDESKAMYVVVDPNGGYEQVVLDVSKAF